MTVLFVMRHAEFVRYFERALEELLGRGHRVHVAFERGRHLNPIVERLATGYDGFSFGDGAAAQPGWNVLRDALRKSVDYFRYVTPAYGDAHRLRTRAIRGTPRIVVRLAERLGTTPAGHALQRALRAAERSVPVPAAIGRFVGRFQPDVLLVSPLVDSAGRQPDYLRAARARGIRTGLVVASWDNLTNKGLIRDAPDRVYVWNEIQRHEATTLHGITPDRVVAVGAHTFDHWFTWRPSTTFAEFCKRVALDPRRPFLLYVCSSRFIANGIPGKEAGFVSRWLQNLRESGDELLREASVLVRPHPRASGQWEKNPLRGIANVVVWPPLGADPDEERARNDYFDSMYHCAAVVGINTSALIEAAIVGRRSYTLRAPDYRDTQVGTLHFHYLLEDNGGPLIVAESFDEHARQLARALRGDGEATGWNRKFLQSFVRPRGLDAPAAPILADEIEALASLPAPALVRRSAQQVALAALLRPLAWILEWRAWALGVDHGGPDAVRKGKGRVVRLAGRGGRRAARLAGSVRRRSRRIARQRRAIRQHWPLSSAIRTKRSPHSSQNSSTASLAPGQERKL